MALTVYQLGKGRIALEEYTGLWTSVGREDWQLKAYAEQDDPVPMESAENKKQEYVGVVRKVMYSGALQQVCRA